MDALIQSNEHTMSAAAPITPTLIGSTDLTDIPTLEVDTVEGAFDLAMTMPYLFCEIMKDVPEQVLVIRFRCSTRLIRDQLLYFMAKQPRLGNKNAKCHVPAISYTMTRRRITKSAKPIGKGIDVYCLDLIFFSKERKDADTLFKRLSEGKEADGFGRVDELYNFSIIPDFLVRLAYEDYMKAIGNGFKGY